MKHRIELVDGYHECTPPCEVAEDSGLTHRFAVIFDPSYVNDLEVQSHFRSFMCGVVEAIAECIYHTGVTIWLERGRYVNSLSNFRNHIMASDIDEWEFPENICFTVGNRLVCLEVTELWGSFGGELPYHDSDTMSFYTQNPMVNEFTGACESACARFEGAIDRVIKASPERFPP